MWIECRTPHWKSVSAFWTGRDHNLRLSLSIEQFCRPGYPNKLERPEFNTRCSRAKVEMSLLWGRGDTMSILLHILRLIWISWDLNCPNVWFGGVVRAHGHRTMLEVWMTRALIQLVVIVAHVVVLESGIWRMTDSNENERSLAAYIWEILADLLCSWTHVGTMWIECGPPH